MKETMIHYLARTTIEDIKWVWKAMGKTIKYVRKQLGEVEDDGKSRRQNPYQNGEWIDDDVDRYPEM